jgi:hypothetical protein
MEVSYDAEADAAYIGLGERSPGSVARTVEWQSSSRRGHRKCDRAAILTDPLISGPATSQSATGPMTRSRLA